MHSGYEFSDTDAGGPNNGQVNACYTYGWKCQHAWREIASMVKFRNTAAGTAVTDWWDNGNQIAFGRGDEAYVAINHEGATLSRTFQTSLPAGSYCDVQSGKGVTVDSSGQFTAALGANTALALHVGAKNCDTTTPPDPAPTAGASFNVDATTQWGENVYVVGNTSALGNWNTSSALKHGPGGLPRLEARRVDARGNVLRVQVHPQGRERRGHLGERLQPHGHGPVRLRNHAERHLAKLTAAPPGTPAPDRPGTRTGPPRHPHRTAPWSRQRRPPVTGACLPSPPSRTAH